MNSVLPKRVFILGAGASISATSGAFPSIETIFHAAKDLSIKGALASDELIRLENYTQRKFGKRCFDKRVRLDVEKMLTLLDIDIESGGSVDYLSIKDIVLKVIKFTIINMQSCAPVNDQYSQFKQLLTFQDLIITFNWDTLLDDVFVAENHNEQAPGFVQWNSFLTAFVSGSELKEGFDLDDYLDSPRPRPFGRPSSGQRWVPSYLKLHGSIDWVTCANPECVAKGNLFRVAEPLSEYFCDYCSEVVRTVIVPPVLNKNLRADGTIRRIWNTASQCIRSAEELVIWGYGLPPTDFYAENLFRFARGRSLRRVELINPEVISKSGRPNPFVRRFEDMLGVKPYGGLNWYRDFESWRERRY